eukprot:6210070-Alexandrium_andersonii.AAC.1
MGPGDIPEFWVIAPADWALQRERNVNHSYRKACLLLHPDKRMLAPEAAQKGVADLCTNLGHVKSATE